MNSGSLPRKPADDSLTHDSCARIWGSVMRWALMGILPVRMARTDLRHRYIK